MITTPSGKNLMNLQEAVQWLLDNNALPFQCTADYVAGAEIGLGTIVNPTPAKVRVGSLIFFADSKVSTVITLTSNSFICSDEYNNLVDDVVYVSNVALNASGHLIVTLSNGDTIDAGLIKQIDHFGIDGSQHLIAVYNDGSATDLGAIFAGNINITGNITASGTIDGGLVTGNEIVEKMSGYSFAAGTKTNLTLTNIYAGACKNGNKVTFVMFQSVERTGTIDGSYATFGNFTIPIQVGNKIYPYSGNLVAKVKVWLSDSKSLMFDIYKNSATTLTISTSSLNDVLDLNTTYACRVEITFLLSDNLAA